MTARLPFVSRFALGIVLLSLCATGSARQPAVAQAPVPGTQWNLAADFRLSPNQANPNPDSYGNPNVWYFMQGTLFQDPASYTLLPEFITDTEFIPGLQQWQGTFVSQSVKDKLPDAGKNATGTVQRIRGITWPADVFRVHPSPTQGAVVGWRSPISGRVSVAGGVTDLDPACGNGVSWSIKKNVAYYAGGSIPNGGAQRFADDVFNGPLLANLAIAQGDFLYIIVE